MQYLTAVNSWGVWLLVINFAIWLCIRKLKVVPQALVPQLPYEALRTFPFKYMKFFSAMCHESFLVIFMMVLYGGGIFQNWTPRVSNPVELTVFTLNIQPKQAGWRGLAFIEMSKLALNKKPSTGVDIKKSFHPQMGETEPQMLWFLRCAPCPSHFY